MQRFVRFQTELRSPHNGCRLGLFYATTVLRRSYGLPDYADDLLEESLAWFNKNLRVPRLQDKSGGRSSGFETMRPNASNAFGR